MKLSNRASSPAPGHGSIGAESEVDIQRHPERARLPDVVVDVAVGDDIRVVAQRIGPVVVEIAVLQIVDDGVDADLVGDAIGAAEIADVVASRDLVAGDEFETLDPRLADVGKLVGHSGCGRRRLDLLAALGIERRHLCEDTDGAVEDAREFVVGAGFRVEIRISVERILALVSVTDDPVVKLFEKGCLVTLPDTALERAFARGIPNRMEARSQATAEGVMVVIA